MKNKLIIPVAGLLAVSFCSVAANAAENKGEISEKTIDMKMENKLIKKATEIITKLREDGLLCRLNNILILHHLLFEYQRHTVVQMLKPCRKV